MSTAVHSGTGLGRAQSPGDADFTSWENRAASYACCLAGAEGVVVI